jgi:hypothetical protein
VIFHSAVVNELIGDWTGTGWNSSDSQVGMGCYWFSGRLRDVKSEPGSIWNYAEVVSFYLLLAIGEGFI